MVTNTVILLAGLPRSGKSTWAWRSDLPIVNRDAIRLALYNKAFIPEAEDMISVIEMLMVKSLFLAGHTKVVVDACHMTQKRRDRWNSVLWNTELVVIHTSKTECLKRCTNPDLVIPIERMAAATDLILDPDE